jgi:HlyD family secretion protein
VAQGDHVEKGQLLAQLDQADLALQVRGAEAALASAQAQLDALREGARPEEIRTAKGQVAAAQAALDQALAQRDQLMAGATDAEIAAAQAAVKSAKASYNQVKAGASPEERAQAQAALDSAQAALQQAQAAYDRVKGREDVGMLPESLALQNATIESKRAQATYDALLRYPTPAELASAEAQVSQAEAQVAQLEAGRGPQQRIAQAAGDAAQAQLDIAEAQLDLLQAGARDSDIAAAEAQVAQAQTGVDSARLASERASLAAPLAGTVASVAVEIGESAGPQLPALTLIGESRFTVEAEVDEADIGWIQVGQEVKITFDAFPDQELAGRVLAVAPLASTDLGIVSYRVTIDSQETGLPLRAGMTANTEIVKERRESVLLVPNLAIALDAETGLKYVDRRTATGIERVEIETGLATDQYSEVVAGLQEGDLVVISSLSAREQFRDLMGATFSGSNTK